MRTARLKPVTRTFNCVKFDDLYGLRDILKQLGKKGEVSVHGTNVSVSVSIDGLSIRHGEIVVFDEDTPHGFIVMSQETFNDRYELIRTV